ncbi:MAG: hypothetical protein AAFY88_00790 [Acidobacteriota bacterium]
MKKLFMPLLVATLLSFPVAAEPNAQTFTTWVQDLLAHFTEALGLELSEWQIEEEAAASSPWTQLDSLSPESHSDSSLTSTHQPNSAPATDQGEAEDDLYEPGGPLPNIFPTIEPGG